MFEQRRNGSGEFFYCEGKKQNEYSTEKILIYSASNLRPRHLGINFIVQSLCSDW